MRADELPVPVGHSDSPRKRLQDLNATLEAAGERPAKTCLALKLRPILADGRPGYMDPAEYEGLRAEIVPADAPGNPEAEGRFWLVERDAVRLVYAEHETGLELLLDPAVDVAREVLVVLVAGWVARCARLVRARIRGAAEKPGPRGERRHALAVEIHAGKRAGVVVRVPLEGEFNSTTLVSPVERGLRAALPAPTR
jgi:hypothetical protein